MSELTKEEQVLKMIEEAHKRGEPVDLRRYDLSGIDLSPETLRQYANSYPLALYPGTGGAYLRGAHLEGAWLGGAHLEGAYLREAHLEEAQLERAHLDGAYLEGAHLETAWLVGAHLEGAYLSWAHLEGAYLSNSALRGAHFYGAYLDKTRFTKAELGRRVEKKGDEEVIVQDKPLIGEEAVGHWDDTKEVYLVIKNSFQSLGRHGDAAWAYVKERQMERKTYRRFSWPLFLNVLEDLSSSYGESPKKVIRWALVFIFIIFPLLFALADLAGLGYLGPFESPELVKQFDPIAVLRYSLASFATMELPSLKPIGSVMELLTALEAIVGISLLALLMYTLGRRMSGS